MNKRQFCKCEKCGKRWVCASIKTMPLGCPFCKSGGTRWESVKAKLKVGVKCDERCTNAKGHNCECSCNGENHGSKVEAPC